MTPSLLLDDPLDLVTHSPDGESRGVMFRVGDIFPMDPRPHQRLKIDDPASMARPWGLRYAQVVQPWAGAGKHESDTKKHTTGGGGDNSSPEDEGTD